MPERKRYINKEYKECSKCFKIKHISEFYKRSRGKYLASRCKDCVREDIKISIQKHIVKKRKRDYEYHLKNRKKRIEYLKDYNKNNREIKNIYFNNKYNNDLNFRLLTNIRNRIRMAIKRNSKITTTKELLGCSIEDLKHHLESQFKEGMIWDNYGEWQIDHIIPCSLFDLTKKKAQTKCFHYMNLRPLWKNENSEKRNKILI